MSTILDALSRAERERRMGQLPVIDSVLMQQQGFGGSLPARHLPWRLIVAAGGLAALALIVTLVVVLHDTSSPPAHAPGQAQAASPRPAMQEPPELPTQPEGAQARAMQKATLPDEASAARRPDAVEPSPPTSVRNPARVANEHPRTHRSMAQKQTRTPAQQSEAAGDLPAPSKPAEKEKAATTTAIAKAAPIPANRSTTELPRLAELPAATRQELPQISLGGYIYSANAADRSILINGKLLREGDQLASGLRLEQMRPDGVVFAYKELRFRMPY